MVLLCPSAVRKPSFSTGGTSSRFQASIVVWAPDDQRLRCRIRYFSDVVILGSHRFVRTAIAPSAKIRDL